MTSAQLEYRVLQLADAVRARKPVEDSLVELKAAWPVAEQKTARKLAGLANAARSEAVLLVVGLDEKAGTVPGASAEELSNWWPQVQKHFSDVAPLLLYNLNVVVDGVTIVGLLFDTARAPFVVKVPNNSPCDREVPWREGNATRSATREDLLRILVPVSRTPRFEMLEGTLTLSERSNESEATWTIYLRIYVTPSIQGAVYFPFHKCSVFIRTLGGVDIQLNSNLRLDGGATGNKPTNIVSSMSEMIVTGPGMARLWAEGKTKKNLFGYGLDFEFVVAMETTDGHHITLTDKLVPSPAKDGYVASWELR